MALVLNLTIQSMFWTAAWEMFSSRHLLCECECECEYECECVCAQQSLSIVRAFSPSLCWEKQNVERNTGLKNTKGVL